MKKIIIAMIFLASFMAQGAFSQETDTFVDSRDGQVYKTVKIGSQVWMAENLNYISSSGSWVYDNDTSNAEIYGRLYGWKTAKQVCPSADGWHLPSDDEWTELTDYLGGEVIAGSKLKEQGTTHWKSPNEGATNETSFSGLPGGYGNYNDYFNHIGEGCYWWSATASSNIYIFCHYLYYLDNKFHRDNNDNGDRLSIRCIKD